MNIFKKLFGNKKLEVVDSDFGDMQGIVTKWGSVLWSVHKNFLGATIEMTVQGDRNGVFEAEKQTLLNALKNQDEIKKQCEKALKEQFENAELEFISIQKHFSVLSASVQGNDFELSFQENDSPHYIFNVHFVNNECAGVSIDG